jgi:hypothetical protein
MAALLLLVLLLVMAAASFLGRTPDSRDHGYDLGRLIGRR